MKTATALLLLCLFARPAQAQRSWTADNTVFAATSTALLVADWRQSLYGARHAALGFYEKNMVLGANPSEQQLNAYFALAAIANLGIAAALPNPWRNVSLGVVTTLEGYIVTKNLGLGARIAL